MALNEQLAASQTFATVQRKIGFEMSDTSGEGGGHMTLEKAFALFDTDGDGKLTEEEVVAVLTRKTPSGTEFSELVARHKWRRWQREFDLNKDGKISYKELVDDMRAHPWKWGVSVGQLPAHTRARLGLNFDLSQRE